MKEINLSNLENIIEDVVLMKLDVEAADESLKKTTFNEFMSSLQIYSTIFVHNGVVIPFDIIKGAKEEYFIYATSVMDPSMVGEPISGKISESFAMLKEKLKTIDYDVTKLEKKNILEMANMSVDLMNSATYFIINDEYYV